MTIVSTAELAGYAGEDLGNGEWFSIDQERISAFADVTMDHQFIHEDPEAAAQTPFGSTIAHGYLTLSLLTHLLTPLMVVPENTVMAINYGLDKVRFLEPVKVDSRIRAHAKVVDVTERNPGWWLVKYEVTVEIEGVDKPAMVAEPLVMFVTG